MCSIFGMITNGVVDKDRIRITVDDMVRNAVRRGRDGIGAHITHLPAPYRSYSCLTVEKAGTYLHNCTIDDIVKHCTLHQNYTMIGNARAEPTTEWVKEKRDYDQQPYSLGAWTIVHNGTIANDKLLRTGEMQTDIDSAAIVEQLNLYCGEKENNLDRMYSAFCGVIKTLKGSYAILATHRLMPGVIFTACNYRPIWAGKTDSGMYLASQANMLPHNCVPQMLEPYTCNVVTAINSDTNRVSLIENDDARPLKALVVASGGMDSTVAAKLCMDDGLDVALINFQYGCRAETNELKAIRAIATDLDVPLVLFPIPIYDPKDSPLFDVEAEIAGGEAGAEFAHEWVPARNLVMLSVATAYAEANGFDYIVLGNNLEEAGAYPDNEPEFINRFNAMLPFAVGDGKRVRVLMPVGNCMKHEIVALGLEHAAPLQHTWSCYRNGEHHCGTCGPCVMRKTAFEINKAEEVIQYEHPGE